MLLPVWLVYRLMDLVKSALVTFCSLIEMGNLWYVQPNLSDDKKPKGRYLTVPWSVKRSGKFTEKAFKEGKNNAFFLWDKTAYCLGVEPKDKKDWKISQLTFDAFKKLHLDLLADTEDEGLRAVCLFLRTGHLSNLNPRF